MKRFKKFLVAALALGLAVMPNVALSQGAYYFWWQAVNEYGEPYTGQTVRCSVYDYPAAHAFGSTEGKVVHLTAELVSGTSMPLASDTNGRLHFYSASSANVRVWCSSAYGASGQSVISTTRHRIFLLSQGTNRMVRFPFVTNSARTRTGVWLPQGSVVRDVIVHNTGKSVTGVGAIDNPPAHLNVGFLGDHAATFPEFNNHTNTAFIHAMSLATDKDWIRPHVQLGFAGGPSPTLILTSHRGVALARWHTSTVSTVGGVDLVTARGGVGFYFEKSYVVDAPNGIEIVYQTSARNGISGHVYLLYDQLHVSAVPSGLGANY